MTRYLVAPQWQGSPSTRAMHLIDGAEAIAGDLPRAATVRVDVPIEAGESLGTGIRRFSAVNRVAENVTTALAASDEPAIVVGGDCGIAVPTIAHTAATHDDLVVVWFDAHADLHSPESSPSGSLAGMALRATFDAIDLPSGGITRDHVILAGAREFDDAEWEFVQESGLRTLSVADLADPAALAAAVAQTGTTAVYVHVDLDVLDPAVLGGLALPVPFGLPLEHLTGAIAAIRSEARIVGASIAGFAPSSPAAALDDLGTILRVLGALK
ncbi:arginase family protein [Microbacterium memoriense]|uniref:Arginase family protein n=1 Tax=Microbacterium memoriense TaxID=2978350 RepID=A0ABT2PEL2_9MICO|nr:arginase family protein [Microbacterium memoriense]MCT9002874.1 arginase family protein [Microbacterium memoriense]